MDREPVAPYLVGGAFAGLEDGAALFAERVLALLPLGVERRVLEIGSGTGDVALRLQTERPKACVVGVDFAMTNVVAARAKASARRPAFVCADYLAWQGGRFDLIAADSVLHLLDAPLPQVAAKLAADLVPGGLVVATVPDAGIVNRLHLLLRRFWRLTPASSDHMALALGTFLYPGAPQAALTDRLPYLRLLPRLFGAAVHRAFADAGLTLDCNERWPSPSLVKPRHRLMVWRRVRDS